MLILLGITLLFFATSCGRKYTCICNYNVNDTLQKQDAIDISGSKNHALHECCTIRKAQLEAAGNKEVLCAVPI